MASAMYDDKHPRCIACGTVFRGGCRFQISQAHINVMHYLRGTHQLPYMDINPHQAVCFACHMKGCKYLRGDGRETSTESTSIPDGCIVGQEGELLQTPPRAPLFDFNTISCDVTTHTLIGVSVSQLQVLVEYCSTLRHGNVTDVINRNGMLLMKMRHDLCNYMLAILFGYKDHSSVSNVLSSVRESLMECFVPHYVGLRHIGRDIVMCNVPQCTKTLHSVPDKNVVLIMDGTYLYTEKSNNYKVQCRFFSVQKGRPLIKPMLIVTPNGFIVDVIGPYVGANNDASITTSLLDNATSDFRQFLMTGDTVLVDRGFRDCIGLFEDLGVFPRMPHFLAKGEKQLHCDEANITRMVTKYRWGVESKNGHLKSKYKMLKNTIPIAFLLHIDAYLRIACALENSFGRAVMDDLPKNTAIVEDMLTCSRDDNELLHELESSGSLTTRSKQVWSTCDATAIEDFSKLTKQHLINTTLGIYQIVNARSYAAEHLKADGAFDLFV